MLGKIEFKPKNEYIDWLEDVIFNQYNYACVNDLQEFNSYKERAVTREGLVKSIKGKHEKDDRPHILRRENYVLGWDNKEKINLLQTEIKKCQEEQKLISKEIRISEQSIEKVGTLKDEFLNLFKTYTKYDEIDWQSYALQIQEKLNQKDKLEKTNDRIIILQEQVSEVKKNLKDLSEKTINNKQKEIFQIEEIELKNVDKTLVENNDIIARHGTIDTFNFEQENPTDRKSVV